MWNRALRVSITSSIVICSVIDELIDLAVNAKHWSTVRRTTNTNTLRRLSDDVVVLEVVDDAC